MSQRSVRLAAARNFISRQSYGDAEFYFASARRQRRILSRFGMTKYPSCGDAVCLNLTRLASRRSARLNSKRFAAQLRTGIANDAALFKISLLNFKRRKPCFEILLLNFSPRTSHLNFKRRSRRILRLSYESSSHNRTATAEIFPRQDAVLFYAVFCSPRRYTAAVLTAQ